MKVSATTLPTESTSKVPSVTAGTPRVETRRETVFESEVSDSLRDADPTVLTSSGDTVSECFIDGLVRTRTSREF